CGGGVPASSGELTVWDVGLSKLIHNLKDQHSDTVFGVAFSPDGKFLASCAADKFLKVTDLSTGKIAKSFEGHTNHVLGCSWMHDGKLLATAGADNAVKIWSMETGEQVRTIVGHSNQVTGARFVGKTDTVATSCADKQARFLNASNGGIFRGFGGANDFLFCIDADDDSKYVASGDQEGKVFVWNGQNAQLMHTLAAPPPPAVAGK
ncbi:MAG: WD40 repeat domain-containing protein, partial [Planctomycetia bacterium]